MESLTKVIKRESYVLQTCRILKGIVVNLNINILQAMLRIYWFKFKNPACLVAVLCKENILKKIQGIRLLKPYSLYLK